ncbi:MAG: KH domain-containing protein [Clostridiales bacterium]|nr:KH domain-containing protein [Clostridiales bacterium]
MQELVKYIAQAMVEKPEAVEVTLTEKDNEFVVHLQVDPDDMGKVIGKQGRIAKAIRTVVKAASPKNEKPYFVEIQ